MATKLTRWNSYSKGAKALAKGLGIKMLKQQGSTWEFGPDDTIINWGASNPSYKVKFSLEEGGYQPGRIINNPVSVSTAAFKNKAFKAMQNSGVQIPEVMSSSSAIEYLQGNSSRKIVSRSLLNSSGGKGIHVYEWSDLKETYNHGTPSAEWDTFISSKLITRYVPKQQEYRIHVHNGKVFDIQRKALSSLADKSNVDWNIRNLENGFVYVRKEDAVGNIDKTIEEQAIKAVKALNLDFGAADVIWSDDFGAFVLEVNTAPGLVGTTLENYINELKVYV